jgi:hypothetical protein
MRPSSANHADVGVIVAEIDEKKLGLYHYEPMLTTKPVDKTAESFAADLKSIKQNNGAKYMILGQWAVLFSAQTTDSVDKCRIILNELWTIVDEKSYSDAGLLAFWHLVEIISYNSHGLEKKEYRRFLTYVGKAELYAPMRRSEFLK